MADFKAAGYLVPLVGIGVEHPVGVAQCQRRHSNGDVDAGCTSVQRRCPYTSAAGIAGCGPELSLECIRLHFASSLTGPKGKLPHPGVGHLSPSLSNFHGSVFFHRPAAAGSDCRRPGMGPNVCAEVQALTRLFLSVAKHPEREP